jgi:hypothetical protein
MQIIPTILEKEFWAAQNKIRHAKNISRWIQIDVIDGVFTEGKTFELELLNSNLEEVENVLYKAMNSNTSLKGYFSLIYLYVSPEIPLVGTFLLFFTVR